MSLRLAGRFARREMRGGLRGFRLFLACLALGVAAIAAVGSVRSAIEGGLQREGAALLGGAAEIDFTYRFATDAERDWIESQASAVSEVVEFRSMAVAGDGAAADRALTQVKAVDDLYPLVGEMVLEPAMPLEQALGLENGLSGAVMERALSDRLGLSPGDTFKLGVKEFRLSALIVREPDSAASGFALGPRTLLRTEALDGADVYLGVSGGTIPEEDVARMAPEAIIFAMANPTPEVHPDVAHKYARIVATGRSDFPNQINNVLAFPGIFRGALDVHATAITEGMKLAAATALAELVGDDLREDYVIPGPFDPRVPGAVSSAVAEAARRDGVARR